MYEIRELPKEDIPQLLEIYAQGVEAGKSTFTVTVPTAEKWDAAHKPFARIGAYEGDLLVGWASLSATGSAPRYAGVCETSLYVRDGYRAKGLGSDIMKRLVEASEKNGVWSLYASIFQTNVASIKMCEKNGFRIVGVRERIAKDKFGVWQNTVNMERRSKIVGID